LVALLPQCTLIERFGAMLGEIFVLAIGFALGYGMREIISRRRRAEARRRQQNMNLL
jgi:hypothetical protein